MGTSQGIGADKVVELRDNDLLRRSFHKAATAQHIVVVEPLRRVRLQVDIPGSIVNLTTGGIILPKIEIIGGSHNVELRQCIMQSMPLALREVALLGENTVDALLGPKTAVEERLAATYALHDFHPKHIGT